jgi:nucleoside-triphosphatase THEP1
VRPPKVILISGGQEHGKTRLCLLVISQLQAQACDVAGIVCPGSYVNKKKARIYALSLRSRETRILATRMPPGPILSGPRTEGWSFDAATLDWGNDVLGTAVPCEALIIDELGPLELIRRQGWTSAFAAVDSADFRLGLIVVRSSLLELALRRWPDAESMLIRKRSNIEVMARRIASQIVP